MSKQRWKLGWAQCWRVLLWKLASRAGSQFPGADPRLGETQIHMCEGGTAWKEAGRDGREEAQDRRASTGHGATFCRHLAPVMLIAHPLQAHTVLRVFAHVILGKTHTGPA